MHLTKMVWGQNKVNVYQTKQVAQHYFSQKLLDGLKSVEALLKRNIKQMIQLCTN